MAGIETGRQQAPRTLKDEGGWRVGGLWLTSIGRCRTLVHPESY